MLFFLEQKSILGDVEQLSFTLQLHSSRSLKISVQQWSLQSQTPMMSKCSKLSKISVNNLLPFLPSINLVHIKKVQNWCRLGGATLRQRIHGIFKSVYSKLDFLSSSDTLFASLFIPALGLPSCFIFTGPVACILCVCLIPSPIILIKAAFSFSSASVSLLAFFWNLATISEDLNLSWFFTFA